MNRTNKKKGFTIVELVIVIAVIGILAAILIPTFVNLTAQANRVSNESFVKNINTQLAMDEAQGKKSQSPLEALKKAHKTGFHVDDITPYEGNDIVYDEINDRYAIVKGDFATNRNMDHVVFADASFNPATPLHKLWKFYDTFDFASGTQTYSIAAKKNWNVSDISNLKVGFDICEAPATDSIVYKGVEGAANPSVIINTNGGTLEIDAKNDDVKHFGYAESVKVTDVKTQSYHENGDVKFLEVLAGHVVLGKDAGVSAFHFTATGEGEAAKFQNADGKKISLDLSAVATENMPAFSRDPVTIEENGTYVAEVTTGTTEYIWLFGGGIKEQMVVTKTEGDIATGGALNEGITAGAEDGSLAEQIANPAKRNSEGKLVDSNNEVIDISDVDFTKANAEEALEAKGVEIVEPADKGDVQKGATLFAGGSGTEVDPFLISDYDTFQHVSDLYDEGYYYFKVKNGVENIDCSNWNSVNLNGSFDGNGVNLRNIDKKLFFNIGAMGTNGDTASWSTKDVFVGNFNAYFKLEGDLDRGEGMAKQILGNNTTTLSNIKLFGQIIGGSNSGALFCYTTGNPYDSNQNVNQKILINDCEISATLVITSGSCGVVCGYPNYCNPGVVITINNPDDIWQGTAYIAGGKIKFVTMSSWTIPEGGTANKTIDCSPLTEETVTKKADGSFSIAKTSNAVRGVVYISAQLTVTDAAGNKTAVAGITMSVQKMGEYDLEGSEFIALPAFSSLEFHNKQAESSATIANGKLIVNIEGPLNYTFGSIKVVVVEYDSNDNVVSYGSKELASKAEHADNWILK